MLLTYDQYDFVTKVPDNWTDFDARREEIKTEIAKNLGNDKADKIVRIIESNWSDFAEEVAILIIVEGYFCLTWIAKSFDEFDAIEPGETVYPFDENRIYPIQAIEQKLSFRRF